MNSLVSMNMLLFLQASYNCTIPLAAIRSGLRTPVIEHFRGFLELSPPVRAQQSMQVRDCSLEQALIIAANKIISRGFQS